MIRVSFTPQLRRFLEVPTCEVEGDTLRAVLDAALAPHPQLRAYVLDDQARIREHVVVYIDGEVARDKVGLSDAVPPGAEVFVMQALSGG